jgi:hypothetical protein
MDAENRPGFGPPLAVAPMELGIEPKEPIVLETTDSNPDLQEKHDDEDAIIRTGADASKHLLPLRDDFDPALTFRSIVLATGLAAFQAVMYQIYQVCQSSIPTHIECRSDDDFSSNPH